jgi:exoribonuclease R
MNWIQPTPDRENCRVFIKMAMNLKVSIESKNTFNELGDYQLPKEDPALWSS